MEVGGSNSPRCWRSLQASHTSGWPASLCAKHITCSGGASPPRRGDRRRHYEHAAALQRTAEMVTARDNAADVPAHAAIAEGGGEPNPQARHQLARVLDDALAKLTASARDAVVLRFFENQSFRQVGDR